jgi:hypothetical protein
MRRLFLFVYSDALGTRDQIKQAVESNQYVLTWRYDLPHCFYLVAEVSARTLAESIKQALPNGYFVISRADDDFWGWNYPETWHLFENKYLKED